MVKIYYDIDADLSVLKGRTTIIDAHVRKNIEKAAKRVRNCRFAKEWLREDREGRPLLKPLIKQREDHPLEKTDEFIHNMSKVANKV